MPEAITAIQAADHERARLGLSGLPETPVATLARGIFGGIAVMKSGAGMIAGYASLQSAKADAQSGDTIVVGPGTYNERNLLKNGVNWYFYPGAKVIYTGGVQGSIFDDTANGLNGPVVCTIGGYGEFWRNCGAVNNVEGVIKITNAGSDVVFFAKSLKATRSTVDGSLHYAVIQRLGRLSVYADYCYGTGGGLWWEGGEWYSNISVTEGDGLGQDDNPTGIIYSVSATGLTGKMWVEGQVARSLNPLGTTINHFPAAAAAQMWVRFKEVISPLACIGLNGGKFYGTFEKLTFTNTADFGDTAAAAIVVDAGLAWITVQKIAGRAVSMSSGLLHLDCMDLLDDTGDTANMMRFVAGEAHLRLGNFKAQTMSGLINDTAKIILKSGARIDTSAVSGSQPIELTGIANFANLILEAGVILKAHSGTTNGIKATNAQNVTNYGYFTNKAKHANITLKVITTETVSADVQ